MGVCTANTWSTDGYGEPERFDAWLEQLNATYLGWRIDQAAPPRYNAAISSRSFENLTFVDCRCEPFRASRRAAEMAYDAREVLGLQLVVSGQEILTIGGSEVSLSAGDILIWDNTRPISFEVKEPLRKLSIILPLSRFKHWLPTSWYTIDKKIAKSSLSGRLLSAFMHNMSQTMFDRDDVNGDALVEATVGLLIDALAPARGEVDDQSLRRAQTMRVYDIINQHVSDGDLTPRKIAALAKISVRYLHWLFEAEGTTVTRYIIQERLQRCRRELGNPAMASRTITDIAFSWGFQNSAHFSRRFKQEFGSSPYSFRNEGEQKAVA